MLDADIWQRYERKVYIQGNEWPFILVCWQWKPPRRRLEHQPHDQLRGENT